MTSGARATDPSWHASHAPEPNSRSTTGIELEDAMNLTALVWQPALSQAQVVWL